jgi:hypothetical protein
MKHAYCISDGRPAMRLISPKDNNSIKKEATIGKDLLP